ncbi:MAG: DUF424 domain-containing protein [Acidilobus sp.]
MPKFAYNVIRTDQGVIVAVADAELLNRRLRASNGVIIEISEDFFGARIGEEPDVVRALSEADMAILVGRNAVSVARDLGLVAPGSEMLIEGVPYVQVFRSLML